MADDAVSDRLVELRHVRRQVFEERAVVQREYDALLNAIARENAEVDDGDGNAPRSEDDECLRAIDARVFDPLVRAADRTEVVHRVKELEFWRTEVRRRTRGSEALERSLLAEVDRLSAALAAPARSASLLPMRQTQSIAELDSEATLVHVNFEAVATQCDVERAAIAAERTEARSAIALLEARLVKAYNATDEDERSRLIRLVGEGERQVERLGSAADALAAQLVRARSWSQEVPTVKVRR
jgi:hypothetical protein